MSENMTNKDEERREIEEFFGCECEIIEKEFSKEEMTKFYLQEREKASGKYIPVIVVIEDKLAEIVEANFDNCGGRDEHVKKYVNIDCEDVEEFVKKSQKETIERTEKFFGELIYGEYEEHDSENYLFDAKFLKMSGDMIVVMHVPVDKPWLVFAYLPFGGWNNCPMTEEMIKFSKHWNDIYGAWPALIDGSTVQFYVEKPVVDADSAMKLEMEHFAFDPDIVTEYAASINSAAGTLTNSKVWTFWWD